MNLKNINFWKIAINIDKTYLNQILFQEKGINFIINKGDSIQINFNNFTLTNNGQIIFKKGSESDFWQAIRVLYFLDVFKLKNEFELKDKNFLISKQKFIEKIANFNNEVIFSPQNNEEDYFYKHISLFLLDVLKEKIFFDENIEKYNFLHSIFIIFLYLQDMKKYDKLKDIIFFKEREKNNKFELTVLSSYKDFCEKLDLHLKQYGKKEEFLKLIEEYYISEEYLEENKTKTNYNENINNVKNLSFNILEDNYKNIVNNDKNNIFSQAENLYYFLQEINCNTNLKYQIPIYQRKYRWERELVENLLEDINKIGKKTNKNHYVGQILMSKSTNNIFNIIDGQQRISTLLLIVKALLFYSKTDAKFNDFINEIQIEFENQQQLNKNQQNDSLAVKIFNVDYFFNKGQKIIENFIRIKGNSDFDNFYNLWNDKVLENNHVHNTFNFILTWIKNKIKNKEDLRSFWDGLLNKIFFVKVVINTNDDFEIFEKTNTRNMPLNVIELLKNKIFHYSESVLNEMIEQEKFQKEFDELILKALYTNKEINSNDLSDKKVENFVKSLYIKGENDELGPIKNQRWYYQLWNYLNSNYEFKSYFDIIEKLSLEIKIFNEITEPEIYSMPNHRFYPLADYFFSLASKVKNNYIFLIKKILELVLRENFNNFDYKLKKEEVEKIRDLLKPIEIFEIRTGLKVEGQSFRLYVERIYDKMVEAWEEKGSSKINGKFIFNLFKQEYKGNLELEHISKMQKRIANETIKSNDQKMIISRFEKFLNPNYDEQIIQNNESHFSLKNSIEHIIPKEVEKWLNEFLQNLIKNNPNISQKEKLEKENNYKQEHLEFLDQIGNILLIKVKNNSEIQNSVFSIKQEKYNSTSSWHKLHKTIYGITYKEINKIKKDLEKLILKDKTWLNKIYSEVSSNTILNQELKDELNQNKLNEEQTIAKALDIYLNNELKDFVEMNLLELNKFDFETIKIRSKIISWVMVLALQDLE